MPGCEYAGRPLGTLLACLRRSMGFGDVACWSNHANPILIATFSHEERLVPVVEVLEAVPIRRRRSNCSASNAPRNSKSQ